MKEVVYDTVEQYLLHRLHEKLQSMRYKVPLTNDLNPRISANFDPYLTVPVAPDPVMKGDIFKFTEAF